MSFPWEDYGGANVADWPYNNYPPGPNVASPVDGPWNDYAPAPDVVRAGKGDAGTFFTPAQLHVLASAGYAEPYAGQAADQTAGKSALLDHARGVSALYSDLDPRLRDAAIEEGLRYYQRAAAEQPHPAPVEGNIFGAPIEAAGLSPVMVPGEPTNYANLLANSGYRLGNANVLNDYARMQAVRRLNEAPSAIDPYAVPVPGPAPSKPTMPAPALSPAEEDAQARRGSDYLRNMVLALSPATAVPFAGWTAADLVSRVPGQLSEGDYRNAALGAGGAALAASGVVPGAGVVARATEDMPYGAMFNRDGTLIYRNAMPWETREAIQGAGGRVRMGADGQPITQTAMQNGYPVQSPMWEVPATRTNGNQLNIFAAYHGSPYEFTVPDASKIGSGEGAQTYGYGHYWAENPKVAETYRNVLKTKAQWTSTGDDWQNLPEGNLYKANIDREPGELLDWDKPLSQQSRQVQDAVSKVTSKYGIKPDDFEPPISADAPGSEWYHAISNRIEEKLAGQQLPLDKTDDLNTGIRWFTDSLNNVNRTAPLVSQAFHEAGLPGIRYLDQTSRGEGAGTHNYVMFPGEEGRISIVEKNGQPIAPSGGATLGSFVGMPYAAPGNPRNPALEIIRRRDGQTADATRTIEDPAELRSRLAQIDSQYQDEMLNYHVGAAPAAVASNPGATLGTFVGVPFGPTRDRAVAMRAVGASNPEIYAATGAVFGPEGALKREISDAGAAVNPANLYHGFQGTYADLLNHPELYGVAPEIANRPIAVDMNGQKSSLGPRGNRNALLAAGSETRADPRQGLLGLAQYEAARTGNFAEGSGYRGGTQQLSDTITGAERLQQQLARDGSSGETRQAVANYLNYLYGLRFDYARGLQEGDPARSMLLNASTDMRGSRATRLDHAFYDLSAGGYEKRLNSQRRDIGQEALGYPYASGQLRNEPPFESMVVLPSDEATHSPIDLLNFALNWNKSRGTRSGPMTAPATPALPSAPAAPQPYDRTPRSEREWQALRQQRQQSGQ